MSHRVSYKTTFFFALFSSSLLASFMAQAGEITKVNAAKKQVMIQLSDEDQWSEGDQIYAVLDGKKKGLIEITKVKGRKALGTITKGKAEAGDTTLAKGDASSTSASEASDSGSGRRKKSKLEGGVLVGFAMDGQSVKLADNSTVKLSGSGMSLKGMGDMSLMGRIGLRIEAGLEQFSAKKTENSIPYETSINYLDLGASLRYRIVDSSVKVFVAIGMNILLPMTKKVSGTVDTSSIAATTVLNLKAGAHIPMGKKYFIPVQLDYLYFPPSSTVTTTVIAGRTGFGMYF